MAKIKIKQGAGDDPSELVGSIVAIAGGKFPFMATIAHKAVKALVVPSTGICDVIPPGAAVPFKVKSYEQVWLVVTDSAALAKSYNSDAEDFVVIEVEGAEQGAPAGDASPDAKKPVSKAAVKAAEAEGE